MPKHLNVMISSTARDLPEHRKQVMDACLRQGMFPVMMEHLPASDDEAIRTSLKMVDDADIYLGVFAHRYGYVPKGHTISVTEMEYNRAVERKIPRLIFVMDKEHPITIADVELGEGAAKLDTLKKRLLADNIVNFFKSPDELRAHAINSLSQYREPDLTAFHYISDIPNPPEAYVAHPYTLLQTGRLIGRQDELNLLTSWATQRQDEICNTDKAIEAATKAYRLAWCDGPPYAYHWGLEAAKKHLRELNAPKPDMPPFDESKYEPMPELEINPKDEFYVDESEL